MEFPNGTAVIVECMSCDWLVSVRNVVRVCGLGINAIVGNGIPCVKNRQDKITDYLPLKRNDLLSQQNDLLCGIYCDKEMMSQRHFCRCERKS